MFTLLVIVVIAFVLRFAFAYGVSAGDDFALSGGTSAVSHRRIIAEILAGTYSPGNEIALNYPYGGVSISGPFFDYFCAVWAKLFTFFGLSNDVAAGAALAWNAPIFGALTCIPVFLIAVRLFKDEIVGLVSAGFYAVFAILIMTAPFSYGTETPMLCFLIAWLVYFLGTAYTVADEHNLNAGKDALADKEFLKWTVLAAVLMALIVLTWPEFWAIMMTAAVMTFFTLLFFRLGGKSMAPTVFVINTVLIVGALAGACYYIPCGMWETVFSGGFIVAICTVAYSILFLFLEKKPWVLSIPVTAIVILAVAVVLYFVAPAFSNAALTGNTMYTGDLMAALVSETSRTRISAMASYYGWLTLWFPLIFGVWMFYNYRKNAKSSAYTFTMLWMLACYCVGWYNASYAVLAGAGFAVGSAILIVTVFRAVDLKSYFRSLRGNGVKAGARKALNFFPLVTVLVTVGLIAVPTAVYAVDAATPTNNEGPGYFGGLGYTVSTTDSNLVNGAWINSSYATKEKTLLSWYGHSDAASSLGGFKTVTSSIGGGTSVMASAYYAGGSAALIASLAIRITEDDPAAYQGKFAAAMDAAKAAELVGLLTDEGKARQYMNAKISEFSGYNAEPSAESLPYIVGVQYLVSNSSEDKLAAMYESIASASGRSINYIEVDAGMIPVYYGDGSYAGSVGYFGDYAMGDFGNPSKYFEVSSDTQQYYQMGYMDRMYYSYDNEFYNTFLWNSLIGVTPSTYGMSSEISLLSSLSSSDGSVRAMPGYGFGHFKMVYWHLNYKASEDADWVEMDATAAIAKQNTEGGFINYLSSVVVYEYTSETATPITVIDGSVGIANVKVAVFTKLKEGDFGYDSSGTVSYVQTSTGFTDASGIANVMVPADHDYLVRAYIGGTGVRDGTLVKTQSNTAAITLAKANLNGNLIDKDGKAVINSGATLTFTGSDGIVKASNIAVSAAGAYAVADLIPDVYTVSVYGSDGTLVDSTTLTVVATAAVDIQAGAGTMEFAIYDEYGNDITNDPLPCTVTVRTSTGAEWTTTDKTVAVLPGDYTVYVSDGTKIAASTSVSISAGETGKASLTVYTGVAAGTAGHTAMAIGYSAVYGATALEPTTAADYITDYSVAADMKKVTGTLKYDGSGTSGTLVFINGTASYVFSAASDGNFTVYLPAGTYDVLAYNTSGAFLKKGFETSAETLPITLGDAQKATFTVNMSMGTTKGLAYIPLTLTVTSNDATYTLYAITGTDGTAILYLPKNASVAYSLSKDVVNGAYGTYLNMDDNWEGTLTLDSDRSATLTFAKNVATGNYVRPIAVASITSLVADDGFYYFDGTKDYYVEKAGASVSVYTKEDKSEVATDIIPDVYTVKSKSDNVFVNETVYIYPTTTSITLDTETVFKVTINKADGTTANVVALPYDNGTEVKYGAIHSESDTVKYLQQDAGNHYRYYVVVKSTDSKIFYSGELTATETVDATALTDMKSLKGYVGSNVSGHMTGAFDGKTFFVDVTDGEYTVELPVNASVSSMKVDASVTSGAKKYSTNPAANLLAAALTVDSDMTRNFVAPTEIGFASEDYEIIDATFTEATGVGNVEVKFLKAGTYEITGSEGFTLDTLYSVKKAANETQVVTGHFSAAAIGAGSEKLGVTITKVGETSGTTLIVPARISGTPTYAGSGSEAIAAPVTAASEGSTLNDVIDGHSYKYVMQFKNTNSALKTLDFSGTAAPAGWLVGFTDASGNLVMTAHDLAGLSSTTLYVMLINETGDSSAAVPAITVAVSGDYAEPITFAGPQEGKVNVDSASASGTGVDNSSAKLSTGFWILLVFTIILFLLIVWGGLKRGVFARRN